MKTAKRFKIVDFINPSGARVYRVTGTLDGKTIRKNFKTKSEAVTFRQQMDVKQLSAASEGQTVWTTLTHEQNRDAIAAINRLKHEKSTKNLSFAVDYFLQHYKEADELAIVEDAIKEYRKQKEQEKKRGILSSRQFGSIFDELATFEAVFQG